MGVKEAQVLIGGSLVWEGTIEKASLRRSGSLVPRPSHPSTLQVTNDG